MSSHVEPEAKAVGEPANKEILEAGAVTALVEFPKHAQAPGAKQSPKGV